MKGDRRCAFADASGDGGVAGGGRGAEPPIRRAPQSSAQRCSLRAFRALLLSSLLALPAFAGAATSSCSVSYRVGSAVSVVAAEPAQFGAIPELSAAGPPSPDSEAGLVYVPGRCIGRCTQEAGDSACETALSAVGDTLWILTESDGVGGDECASQLNAVSRVRSLQSRGASGVLLLHPGSASVSGFPALASEDVMALNIPLLWVAANESSTLLTKAATSSAWSRLRVTPRCVYEELSQATPMPFELAAGHTLFFKFAAPTTQPQGFRLQATPRFGHAMIVATHVDGTTAAALRSTPLPNAAHWMLSSRGQEPMLQATQTLAGTYLFALSSATGAAGSLQLALPHSPMRLVESEDLAIEVASQRWALASYQPVDVASGTALRLSASLLSGDALAFVCASPPPELPTYTEGASTFAAPSGCQELGALSASQPFAAIDLSLASWPGRFLERPCSSAGCTPSVAIFAQVSAYVTISAAQLGAGLLQPRQPALISPGLPHLARTSAGTPLMLRVFAATGDLPLRLNTLKIAHSCGPTDLRLLGNLSSLPPLSVATGDIDAGDPLDLSWDGPIEGANTELSVQLTTELACDVSLAASNAGVQTMLGDGVPHVENSPANLISFYSLLVPDARFDVSCSLSALSGEAKYVVSTQADFAASELSAGSVLDAQQRNIVELRANSELLVNCARSAASQGRAGCVLYISVKTPVAARFSLRPTMRRHFGVMLIDAPAALAAELDGVFAPFGRGLPYDPMHTLRSSLVKQPLALPTPADACSEDTDVSTLSGKIALVEAGNCSTLVQALRVQRGGALAAIIVPAHGLSPLDPTRALASAALGAQSLDRLQQANVSVVIGHGPVLESDAEQAALRDGSLRVTLRPPFSAPLRLVDGQPFRGVAQGQRLTSCALSLASASSLRVSLVAEYGHCVATISLTSEPPTLSHFDAAISSLDDPLSLNVPSGATEVLFSVFSPESCGFILTVSQNALTSLLDGVPTRERTAAGGASYFRFAPQLGHDVQLDLTPLAGGEADLYVSHAPTLPTELAYTWKAAERGGDRLRIAADEPDFHPPQSLIVMVLVETNASYTLSANNVETASAVTTALLPGVPQIGGVEGNGWTRFLFQVPGSNSSGDVALELVSDYGDPDLYVNVAASDAPAAWPDAEVLETGASRGTWRSVLPGSDSIRIWGQDPNGCAMAVEPGCAQAECVGCTYYISVRGFESARFTLTARVLHTAGPVFLQEGVQFMSSLRRREMTYFDFIVSTPTRVNLQLTSFSGDADLFASFDDPRPRPEIASSYDTVDAPISYESFSYEYDIIRPPRDSYDTIMPPGSSGEPSPPRVWSSSGLGSLDSIDIFPGADFPSSLPATLHIGVLAYGDAAEFGLLVRQGNADVQLTLGRPTQGSLDMDAALRYSLTIPADSPNTSTIVFELTPNGGDPDLFVTAQDPAGDPWGSPPDPDLCGPGALCWASFTTGLDLVAITPDDPHYCTDCTYTAMVYAYSGTSYSIVARAANGNASTVVTLQEGVPFRTTLSEHEYQFFRLPIPGVERTVELTVTPFYGDPDVFASFVNPRPTLEAHNFSAQGLGTETLSISHFDPRFCPRVPCVLYVSVFSFRATSFSLLLSSSGENRTKLLDGVPQAGRVQARLWQYYNFEVNDDSLEAIDVSLAAEVGDPDMYISSSAVPTTDRYGWKSSSRGSDEVQIRPDEGSEWCTRCTYTIGVFGFSDSNYVISAVSVHNSTQPGQSLLLQYGTPTHGSVEAGKYTYYKLLVDNVDLGLQLELTPTLGEPVLFASFVHHFPNSTHSGYRSTGYQWGGGSLSILSSSGDFCPVLPCVLFVSVTQPGHATFSSSRYTLVARSIDNRPVRLLDGTAQFVASSAKEWRYFEFSIGAQATQSATLLHADGECASDDRFLGTMPTLPACADACRSDPDCTFFTYGKGGKAGRCFVELTRNASCPEGWVEDGFDFYQVNDVAQSQNEFTVTVAPVTGDPDIYVRSDGGVPDQQTYGWHAVSYGEDVLTVDEHDQGWCAGCTYTIGVFSAGGASSYSITAATEGAAVVLEDGVPHQRTLAGGEYQYFRVYVSAGGMTDVRLTATPMSGSVTLFASWAERRPNATDGWHTWSSTDGGSARLDIDHTDVNLNTCLSRSWQCVLFVSAVAADGGSTYTVVANLEVVDSGLTIDAPVNLAGGLVFAEATFGGPLPVVGVSTEVELSDPWLACDPLDGAAAEAVAGRIALVARGSCFFAEKAMNVQQAGATAMIVVNTGEDLTRMSDALGADVYIPLVMVSHEDGTRLQVSLGSGHIVRATLRQPKKPPTTLLNGIPQTNAASETQLVHFKFVAADDRAVSISLTPSGGDADLYVNANGQLPTPSNYTWRGISSSADAVVIGAGSSASPADRTYLIGVLVFEGLSSYTIVASTAGTAVTAALGVPLFQQAPAGGSALFRVFAQNAESALQIAVTPLAGIVSLLVDRTVSRLSAINASFVEESGVDGAHAAALRLSPEQLRAACATSFPCTFFARVRSTNTSLPASFILLASDEAAIPQLLVGTPQSGLVEANSIQHFLLPLPVATAAVALSLHVFGSPVAKLLAAVGTVGSLVPLTDPSQFEYMSDDPDALQLSLSPQAGGLWCPLPPCAVLVGVLSDDNTLFSLSAQLQRGARECDGTVLGLSCFEFLTTPRPWLEAEASCAQRGGHLASIATDEENTAALQLCVEDCWIGFNDRNKEGNWKWTDGRPVELPRWSPGEPSGTHADNDGAYMYSSAAAAASAGKWADAPIGTAHAFLCRRELDQLSGGRETVTLQEGVAQTAEITDGSAAYFDLLVNPAGGPVSVQLTAFSGEPRLFASVADDLRAEEEAPIRGSPLEQSQMLIRVEPDQLRDGCVQLPCVLHIGVAASVDGATFSILAQHQVASPVALTAGEPLDASLGQGQTALYSFYLPGNHSILSLTVTPLDSSDPDLYVSAGVQPTRESAHWKSLSGGADTVTAMPSDPHYCGDCQYVAMVFAYTASRFRIIATVETYEGWVTPVTLQDGVPYRTSVSTGRYLFFHAPINKVNASIRVTITPFSGDPDLYASFTEHRPTQHLYNYSALGTGNDSLHISRYDPHFCPSSPCTLFIGAFGYRNSSFSLLLTQSAEVRVRLVDGQPQSGFLAPKTWQYYTFRVGAPDVDNFKLQLEALSGDPDVFVSAGATPTTEEYGWRSNAAGSDELVVSAGTSTGWCSDGCDYTIGVYSYGATDGSEYTLTVTSDREPSRVLQANVPLLSSVQEHGYRYFEYVVSDSSRDISITLTALSGDPDLYASFSQPQPSSETSSYSLISNDDIESITVHHADVGFCSPTPCSLYIAVFGYLGSSFSLLVGQGRDPTPLTDGVPQRVDSPAESWRYFSFSVAQSQKEFTVTAAPVTGDPDIYVRSDGGVPDQQTYGWHAVSYGEDVLTVDEHDQGWCTGCTYTIGVFSAGGASSYSITAATEGAAVVLEDGVPHQRTLAGGEYQYFRVYVSAGGMTDVRLTATPMSGSVTLFASWAERRPNATDGWHTWSSTDGGSARLDIDHTDVNLNTCLSLSWQCVLFVSAVAADGGSTYTVVANLEVVDSGLTIDTPANLAGNLVFDDATFGGPLPVVGVSTEVVLSDPWLACDPLDAAAAAPLAGRIALVSRGSCTFWTKALNVQQAGATAMIVVNTGEGTIRMGAGGSEAGEVHIPLVMVSHEDGMRLKTEIDLKHPVNATLHLPSTRATQLLPGLPQSGELDPGALAAYRFSVDGASQVLVWVSTLSAGGDVDVYVNSNGRVPTTTSYQHSATRAGSDALLLHRGDAGFVESGAYDMAVWNAGVQRASYSIVASTDLTPVALRLGVPLYSTVQPGAPNFFEVRVPQAEGGARGLRFGLTPLGGVPALCVSRNLTELRAMVPLSAGASGAPLEATSRFVEQLRRRCTWSAKAFEDAGALVSSTHPEGGAGVYYVAAVTASLHAEFSLAVRELGSTVALIAGHPQQDELDEGGWNYYTLRLEEKVANVTLTLSPTEGDPDMFVAAGSDLPDGNNFLFSSQEGGADVLFVPAAGPLEPPCTLVVGVFGWSATAYTLVAAVAMRDCTGALDVCSGEPSAPHATVLQPGRSFAWSIAESNASALFDLSVADASAPLTLSVTPLSGRPLLIGSFGDESPTPQRHQWGGERAIALSPTDAPMRTCLWQQQHGAGEACVLHAAVFCARPCSFSIVGGSDADTPTSLVDRRPQELALPPGEYGYLSLKLPPNATGLTLSLTTFVGEPRLCVAVGSRARPTLAPGRASWVTRGESELTIRAADADFCSGCTYTIGVVSSTQTRFSITASVRSSRMPAVTLQDQVPHRTAVAADECELFTLRVDDPTASVHIFATALSGFPTLYAAYQPADAPLKLPSPTNHGGSGWTGVLEAAFSQEEIVIPAMFVGGHLGVYLVTACGTQHSPASLVITARLNDRPRILPPGAPQLGAVAARGWQYYTFLLGAASTRLALSLSMLAGAAQLFLKVESESDVLQPPHESLFTWKAMRAGEQIVLVQGNDGFAPGASYIVGVYGVTAAVYNVLVNVDQTQTALLEGVPTPILSASPNQLLYFAFELRERAALSIAVTPISGDPDVFVSTTTATPAASTATWSSAQRGRTELIRVEPSDPRFALGTYHVGVGGTAECSFSVLASTAGTVIFLADGQPQLGALQPAEWAYYKYLMPADTTDGLLVSVTPKFGNPDLFVVKSGALPTSAVYGWHSAMLGEDQLLIDALDDHYCSGCTYTIGVRAARASNFSIVARLAGSTQTLQLDTPVTAHVPRSTQLPHLEHYRLILEVDAAGRAPPLDVQLSSLSGRVSVALSAKPRPTAFGGSLSAKAEADSGATLSLSADDATKLCAQAPDSLAQRAASRCLLYIAVEVTEAGSVYTLTASATQDGGAPPPLQLAPGRPLFGQVAAGAYRYYKLEVQEADDFSINVAPTRGPGGRLGEVDVFVQVKELPTVSHSQWRSSADGGDTVLVNAADAAFCTGCTYFIGVHGRTAANYSIAADAPSHSMLLPGGELEQIVPAGGVRFLTLLQRPGTKGDWALQLEPCAGAVDVFYSRLEVAPTQQRHDGAVAVDAQPTRLVVPGAALGAANVFVSIRGRTDAACRVRLAPADEPAPPVALRPGGDGVLRVADVKDVSAVVEWFAAAAVDGASAEVWYDVFVSSSPAEAVFGTECGVRHTGELLTQIPPGAAANGSEGRLQWPLSNLRPGQDYIVNVVARRGDDETLYQPVYLRSSGGGGSHWLVVLLVLLLVALAGGVGFALLRRRPLPTLRWPSLSIGASRWPSLSVSKPMWRGEQGTRARLHDEQELLPATGGLYSPPVSSPLQYVPPASQPAGTGANAAPDAAAATGAPQTVRPPERLA